MLDFSPWNEAQAGAIIAEHAKREGATLPILHHIQATFGCVPLEAEPLIAAALNLSRAEVHGIVTFYHDFRRHPPGRHVIKLCRAEACQAVGSDAIAAAIRDSLGIGWHETTPDGRITLEPVFCLGLCACAPAALIDSQPIGRLVAAGQLAAAALADRTAPAATAVTPTGWAAPAEPTTPRPGIFSPRPGIFSPRPRIFIPRDAAALALGADAVAEALAPHAAITRTGSRGLFWLEPMIEVETPEGRIAYGPVHAADIPELLATGLLSATAPEKRLGPPEQIPFLARQTRLTFARCGIVDPLSLEDYRAHGGLAGLEKARALGPAASIETILKSGLRGRGGAGFPTGIKWQTAAEAPGDRKYIVCNADEGDSGTYADRMLLEGDPFSLIEGMAIAAHAIGATKGYVYTRSEYPNAIATFDQALAIAREAGLLGADFDIEQRVGAGAYVCGEETSLLESLEGRRGQVRAKPPLPAHKGLFGCSTVINNLVTLATVPVILKDGADAYQAIGIGRSRGTVPIQLAGNVRHAGLFEAGFGLTLGELVHDIGGGTRSGRPIRAVQVGGPLGAYFPPSLFDTPFDYEAFAAKDGLIGHGGIVVFDDTVDLAHQARFAMEFCAVESCGKCTPCRIGSIRGMETVDKIIAGEKPAANLDLLRDLCHTMKYGSLCALGGFIPYPVLSALDHFPEDFRPREPLAAE